MRYDAIVIGAGLSGLGAGIRLAQFDRRVLLVERHTVWGGLNSFYKLEGRLFDSGLHALTNFARRDQRAAPLNRILRQLRIPHEALELGEQGHSEIRFPGARLAFSNDLALLRAEIAARFPSQRENFERLLLDLPAYEAEPSGRSARAELAARLSDELLVEMLLCPVMFYGAAGERDLAWEQFGLLFRSIFLEGFARPAGGMRALLGLLAARYKAVGGELALRTGVAQILHEHGIARGVVTDDGRELEADLVLSSAGWVETLRLAGLEPRVAPAERGRLSFVETIAVLDREPRELGYSATTTFFNDAERFEYARPAGLVDLRSGVICTPNNYAREAPLPEGLLRVTLLANHDAWQELDPASYAREKLLAGEAALAIAARHACDVRPHRIFQDVFTPCTIRRYTGHDQGAVYGSPVKRRDGSTGIERLKLIGTDQGLVGIVGALLSGITIANQELVLPGQEAAR